MQRRTLIFAALLAVFAAAVLSDAAGIKLKRPSDLQDRVTESCNSTCIKSCNATWNEYNAWFKDMDSDDAEKCDVCAVTYYAQDFNVEIGKCPCKTLEQFRKLALDKSIVTDGECAECCLDWALDAISYDEDCKDPSDMKPSKDKEEKGSYRNECGFTISAAGDKRDSDKDSDKEEKKEKKDDKEDKEDKEEESDKSEEEVSTADGVYDYESLGSQFDTCKCICKGLAPCKAPKEDEEEESSEEKGQSAASFFDSAAFSGPEEMDSTSASMDDALSAILP